MIFLICERKERMQRFMNEIGDGCMIVANFVYLGFFSIFANMLNSFIPVGSWLHVCDSHPC
jgi:hypothetical protein